jgi:hypothetical protein
VTPAAIVAGVFYLGDVLYLPIFGIWAGNVAKSSQFPAQHLNWHELKGRLKSILTFASLLTTEGD